MEKLKSNKDCPLVVEMSKEELFNGGKVCCKNVRDAKFGKVKGNIFMHRTQPVTS